MRPKDSSAPPSRFATCDWYYQMPLTNEKKSEVPHPPTSQIPGLSDLAEPHDDLMTGSRKKWIRDTDSEYVKLAKQGGRPDLLKHTTPVPKKSPPVSYAAPDWYTDDLTSPPEQTIAPLRNVPDYMIHEEFDKEESEQTYEARKGPFDFDQKTIWQRESEENENENHPNKVKLPAIKQDNNVTASGKGPPPTKTGHDRPGKKCFFPPMPGNRNDSVNFNKLLSNGYGDDWFRHHDEQETKATPKSKTFKNFG